MRLRRGPPGSGQAAPEESHGEQRSHPGARARRIVAFTYPRDKWYVRAGFVVENSWYRLRQDPFRAFVHSPQRMASVLESAGFVRAARLAKLQWALDLYRRA